MPVVAWGMPAILFARDNQIEFLSKNNYKASQLCARDDCCQRAHVHPAIVLCCAFVD